MDCVYVVLRWDKYNSPQYIVEAYETLQDAQYRARGLSVGCIGVVPEVKIEKFLETSECWSFFVRNDAHLFIYKVPFTPNRLVFNQKKTVQTLADIKPVAPIMSGEPDNPYSDFLPAGWFHSGTPAMMSDLWYNPDNIENFNSLREPQKWALTKARIRNRPSFYWEDDEARPYYQIDALLELEWKTDIGKLIVDKEISLLEEIRITRSQCINDEV